MAGIYRYFSKSGELLYIGSSKVPVVRLAQHRSESKWYDEIARVEIQQCESRRSAGQAERAAIRAEKPKWNKMLYERRRPLPAPRADERSYVRLRDVDMLLKLRAELQGRTPETLAAKIGCSVEQIEAVLNSSALPPPAMLEFLNLEQMVVYRIKDTVDV